MAGFYEEKNDVVIRRMHQGANSVCSLKLNEVGGVTSTPRDCSVYKRRLGPRPSPREAGRLGDLGLGILKPQAAQQETSQPSTMILDFH